MRLSHGLRAASQGGLAIGQPLQGGFFAGYISHTADGVPTHALIVSPAATGGSGTGYTITTTPQLKTTSTSTPGTLSEFDGRANTDAMITAGIAQHPAAQFCVNLSIGGYTDWYLPARYELEIAYYNLKPGTTINSGGNGVNNYSVPKRMTDWTQPFPAQTTVTAFQTGQAEAFVASGHYASNENISAGTQGWVVSFGDGAQLIVGDKTTAGRCRAFRRITL